MKNKIILTVSSLIFMFAAFIFAKNYYSGESSTPKSTDLNFLKFIPIDSPKLGSPTAKVFIVEFMDPECETCREFYPFLKMALQEFEGKIQLVVRYAPFHPNSKFVIKILEASRKQNKYWTVLETLFQFQPQWSSHDKPNPDLVWKYLRHVDLDLELLKKELTNPQYDDLIEREIRDLQLLGVKLTPTFFVNGSLLEDYSYDGLKGLIEKELSKVE